MQSVLVIEDDLDGHNDMNLVRFFGAGSGRAYWANAQKITMRLLRNDSANARERMFR